MNSFEVIINNHGPFKVYSNYNYRHDEPSIDVKAVSGTTIHSLTNNNFPQIIKIIDYDGHNIINYINKDLCQNFIKFNNMHDASGLTFDESKSNVDKGIYVFIA